MKSATSAENRFPVISMWNPDPKKILFINEGFSVNDHLQLRGLRNHSLSSSFGTAELDEAIKRQNLLKLLMAAASLRDFAIRSGLAHSTSVIPRDGQAFVDYFNPNSRNAFWVEVDKLLGIVDEINRGDSDLLLRNPEFMSLVDTLRQEMARLENSEAGMGKHVITELLKSTYLSGTLTVRLVNEQDGDVVRPRFSVISTSAVGHRVYALNTPSDQVYVHAFWNNKFWRKIGFYDFLFNRAKKHKQKEIRKWASPIIINDCPSEIIDDIRQHLNQVLESGVAKGFALPNRGNVAIIDLVARFSYSQEGLRVKMVGVSQDQGVPDSYEESWSKEIPAHEFRYYSRIELSQARTLAEETRRRSYITYLLSDYYPKLQGWFAKNAPALSSEKGEIITSERSDHLFKWRHAETLCKGDLYRETFTAAKAVRSFASKNFSLLQQVADIANTFLSRSKKWKLPITFPELVDGGEAQLSFHEMYPVSLIGRVTSGSHEKPITARDLRPITALGDISGGISMMTGDNGAGKTTTGEELLGVLFDAGNGFPVFGTGVKLNLRNVIGSIYLERGDGSTMELSLGKLAQVVEEVGKHSRNGTFVFWDEAGTGTTAHEGEILGMRVLSKLRETGCTVLVNTQIPSLAEKAQSQLGAQCFQVNMRHQISAGIGEPNIVALAKRMGVDKVLGLD